MAARRKRKGSGVTDLMPILDLQAFMENEIPRRNIEIMKKFAMEALARVVKKSPVKTGRFRANWNVGIGKPDTFTTNSTLNEAEMRGVYELRKLRTPYIRVYVTNNLEYARALEHGHSKQAPQGVVGITVAELVAFAEEIMANGL